jgi:hypothetical protein
VDEFYLFFDVSLLLINICHLRVMEFCFQQIEEDYGEFCYIGLASTVGLRKPDTK